VTTKILYPKRVVDLLDGARIAHFSREDFLYLAHAALDQATRREDVSTAAPGFKAIEALLPEEAQS